MTVDVPILYQQDLQPGSSYILLRTSRTASNRQHRDVDDARVFDAGTLSSVVDLQRFHFDGDLNPINVADRAIPQGFCVANRRARMQDDLVVEADASIASPVSHICRCKTQRRITEEGGRWRTNSLRRPGSAGGIGELGCEDRPTSPSVVSAPRSGLKCTAPRSSSARCSARRHLRSGSAPPPLRSRQPHAEIRSRARNSAGFRSGAAL